MYGKQLKKKKKNLEQLFLNILTALKYIEFINSCFLQFTYDTKSKK